MKERERPLLIWASPAPELSAGLAAAGIDVLGFDLSVDQAPDPDPVLVDRFMAVIAQSETRAELVIGGWSLGGRIAAQVCSQAPSQIPKQVSGLVCLGYPFHPVRQPTQLAALDRLRQVELPTLIVQGSRDAFGNREQVRGYRLEPRFQVCWLEDANHRLQPRARAEFSAEELLAQAIAEIAAFVAAR